MTAWVSPVPAGGGAGTRTFRPGVDVRVVADTICARGWKNPGVHVFRWPCGTVSVVTVGRPGDVVLMRNALPHLFATYVRDSYGVGPKLVDVIDALTWARSRA